MYHTSLSHRRSSSPMSGKVWNHNTGYTGAAGIHSEVGSGAHARNTLTERRTSNALTAEEEIMKKEMKKLQANRKELEKSMLKYSQKMRGISERKSNNFDKSPVPLHSSVNHKPDTVKEQSIKRKVTSSTSLPIISSNSPKETRDDFSVVSDNSNQSTARKQESRLSLDSGISLDSHCDSSRSLQEAFLSDTDSNSSVLNTSHSCSPINNKDDISSSDKRGRARQRKNLRNSKTCKFMPLVDKEIKEKLQTTDDSEEEIRETPRIAHFPGDILQHDSYLPSLDLASITENDEILQEQSSINRVGGNVVGKKSSKSEGSRKIKTKTPYVLFRPKVSQSPSVAALRHRFYQRLGPNSICFKYSEEVLEALQGLNGSPQRRESRSLSPRQSSVSSSTLHGIDMEEVLDAHSLRSEGLFSLLEEEGDVEISTRPKLNRERNFFVSSSKGLHHSFASKLEQVEENDDSSLKSVLKKDDRNLLSYNRSYNKKKSVQFFLPDIFMKSNVCMSQPAEY